jgi:hypothetical protein
MVRGLGHFYNGDVKNGWIRLAIAVLGGSVTYGLAWFGVAIWSALDTYNVASGKSSLGDYLEPPRPLSRTSS